MVSSLNIFLPPFIHNFLLIDRNMNNLHVMYISNISSKFSNDIMRSKTPSRDLHCLLKYSEYQRLLVFFFSGVIVLNQEHTVCTAGQALSTQQAVILVCNK